jgi:hypothetical protein
MSARPTEIYFVATEDRSMVKIGSSYQIAKRLAGLQAWMPVKLVLIAVADGTIDDERALHTTFFPHHSHGEWFKGHPDIYAVADAINATGELPAHLRGIPGQKSPLYSFAMRRWWGRSREKLLAPHKEPVQ